MMDRKALGKIEVILDELLEDEVTRRVLEGPSGVGAYFTMKQLSERWGVHERTVHRLVLAGRLKHVRVGDAIRVRWADAQAYEDSSAKITAEETKEVQDANA